MAHLLINVAATAALLSKLIRGHGGRVMGFDLTTIHRVHAGPYPSRFATWLARPGASGVLATMVSKELGREVRLTYRPPRDHSREPARLVVETA